MKHKHHIVPRHSGGTDDPENIIELTIEEHAEAHRLLWVQYGKKQDRLAWQGLLGLLSKQEIIKEILSEAGKKGGSAGKGVSGNRKNGGIANWNKNREQIIKTLRENGKYGHLGGTPEDKWIWINNTEQEIKVLKDCEIPEGWQTGRIKMSGETKEKIRRTCIERGINKGIKRTKEHKKQLSEYRKGRSWYHNPNTGESSMLSKDDKIPEGWIKGRGKINRHKRTDI
jgi:hypothetical protein